MSSPCCGVRWAARGWTGPTEPCWPDWPGCCPARTGTGCSSGPRRCCVGITTWSDAAGATRTGVAVPLCRLSFGRWWCGWPGRTRPGDIAASTVSCAGSATRTGSAPARCGPCFGGPASIRHRCGRRSLGGDSYELRLPVCWRWTSSPWTRSCCGGCMCCLRLRWPPVGSMCSG